MAKSKSELATVAQIGFILLAATGVYSFVAAAQADQRRTSCGSMCTLHPAYAGRDRLAPDFELPDAKGNLVKLSSFRGKTVFLNFWTGTCGPCLKEMPSLVELAKIAKTRSDFVVLTVSTDSGMSQILDPAAKTTVGDALRVAVGGDDIPFPVLFDPDAKIVADKYGTHLFPETWLIDPKGVIRARFDGGRDWSMPIVTDIAEMVARPGGCPVEFFENKPRGAFAGLCEEDR